MKLNGAEITIKLLEYLGVKTIAGIPGGSNLPLYDALYNSKIQHILTRHEQGAGFISQGISRSTGDVAVCFATSGPGATNLITAIADAKLDSIPIIAITGQVPYSMIGTDAFQEVDMYGLTIPITKHNFLIRSIYDLFEIIPEAFKLAIEGRPGPILIDIPKDIQTEVIEIDSIDSLIKKETPTKITSEYSELNKIINEISSAKKPLILAGGGIISSNAEKELKFLAENNDIPVALTLMGLGGFPSNNPLYLGMIGMHGAPYSNFLMEECDLLIALGIRFDDRATGDVEKFCSNATIIHIDIDESEINKIKNTNYSIKGDLKDVLTLVNIKLTPKSHELWLEEVDTFKVKYPSPIPSKDEVFHPVNILNVINEVTTDDTIICTDVGQHQMWTAQNYKFQKPCTFLTSSGLGTMGFGIPAAIGAALANGDTDVLCITGDGSILMNIQELATLSELNLNVKIIIFNNHHLGLVRQQQELFYNNNIMASKFIKNPDFVLIAKGFGIDAYTLEGCDNPMDKLKELLDSKGPLLINIPIEETANVLPMVPPGKENTIMIGVDYNE